MRASVLAALILSDLAEQPRIRPRRRFRLKVKR
jgi:hypothetical protein